MKCSDITVLVDTCFWLELFSSKNEETQREAKVTAELITDADILVPWPTIYETLRSRFFQGEANFRKFNEFLSKPKVHFLENHEWTKNAYEALVKNPSYQDRRISLVDSLLREIILDPNIRTDYFLTFNHKDFGDIMHVTNTKFVIEE